MFHSVYFAVSFVFFSTIHPMADCLPSLKCLVYCHCLQLARCHAACKPRGQHRGVFFFCPVFSTHLAENFSLVTVYPSVVMLSCTLALVDKTLQLNNTLNDTLRAARHLGKKKVTCFVGRWCLLKPLRRSLD